MIMMVVILKVASSQPTIEMFIGTHSMAQWIIFNSYATTDNQGKFVVIHNYSMLCLLFLVFCNIVVDYISIFLSFV